MGYKERLQEYRARSDAIFARAAAQKEPAVPSERPKSPSNLNWFEDDSLKTPAAIFRARFGPARDMHNPAIWRQLMGEQNKRKQLTKTERDIQLFNLIRDQYRIVRDAAK